jgi:hypothetical protein
VSTITTSVSRARPASTASKATGAAGGADEVRPGPLGPDLELLLGRGAERVGRTDQHGAAVVGERSRELADGRRLARPIDADDEEDRRPARGPSKRRRNAEQGLDLLRERLAEVTELTAGLEPPDELGGGRNADVGADQRDLEPLPRVLPRRVE